MAGAIFSSAEGAGGKGASGGASGGAGGGDGAGAGDGADCADGAYAGDGAVTYSSFLERAGKRKSHSSRFFFMKFPSLLTDRLLLRPIPPRDCRSSEKVVTYFSTVSGSSAP